MHLRDHPLMTRNSGYSSWPPIWTTTHHDKNDKPIGEVGTLEEVLVHALLDSKIFLFMMFEGSRYLGFLSFDDERFCSQIYTLLKSKAGLSIKEIGDLDLSYTL